MSSNSDSPSAGRLAVALKNRLVFWFRRWTTPDPHAFLRRCSSLAHVGANSGQERSIYAKAGLSVIWVEPIPSVYAELVANIAPYPRQRAIRALLTDKTGDTVTLNIANNSGASSSIFDLAQHKDIWPEVEYVDRIEMQTDTLDHLLAEAGATDVDALILDTQGSELMVLKGASATLAKVNFVKVEAADFESYTGCATVDTITGYLSGFSLRLYKKTCFARHPSGGGYYDLLFKRVGTP